MLEPERGDFLPSDERQIRLYLSYAEANVVRTKVAQVLQDRAVVSRLKSITGGWAFTIQRDHSASSSVMISKVGRTILNRASDIT